MQHTAKPENFREIGATMLQFVALHLLVLVCFCVCCGVLQSVAVCCSVLQCDAVCCSVLQCVVEILRALHYATAYLYRHIT